MFKPENGFLQFVFANDDRYCLPSMVHLTLPNYLYYELKKAGYENIVFGRGIDGFKLCAYESSGAECLSRAAARGILHKIKNMGAHEGEGAFQQEFDGPDFGETCLRLLKNSSRTALVLDLDTFYAAHQQSPELTEKLIRSKSAMKNSRNMILLKTSVSASDSQRILMDPEGPFGTEVRSSGECLCQSLKFMIGQPSRVPLYGRMQSMMPNQVFFLNRFSADDLKKIIRYVLLKKQDFWITSEDMMNMVSCLFYWHFSDPFRKQHRLPLRSNPKQAYSVLEEDLMNRGGIESLLSLSRELARDPNWRDAYKASSAQAPRIIPENNLSSLLKTADIPDHMDEIYMHNLQRIQEFFSTSWNHPLDPEAESNMHRSIEFFIHAVESGNEDGMKSWIRLISECGLDCDPRMAPSVYKMLNQDFQTREKYADLLRVREWSRGELGRQNTAIEALEEELRKTELDPMDSRLTQLSLLKQSRESLEKEVSSQNVILSNLMSLIKNIEGPILAGTYSLDQMANVDLQGFADQIRRNEENLSDLIRKTAGFHQIIRDSGLQQQPVQSFELTQEEENTEDPEDALKRELQKQARDQLAYGGDHASEIINNLLSNY